MSKPAVYHRIEHVPGLPGGLRRWLQHSLFRSNGDGVAFRGLLLPIVLAFGVSGCSSSSDDPDTATLTAYVHSYVGFLNRGEEASLARHLANPAQPQDASDRLVAFGRRGLHDVSITWTSEFPRQYQVNIRAIDSRGAVLERQEEISWERDRGVMGPLKLRPGLGTASTERPSAAPSGKSEPSPR